MRNSYDAFGIPNINNNGRFGYTGQLWSPELGLNYYRARMYSPQRGRFLQTDPIGYADNTNWYAYVGNDPARKGWQKCDDGSSRRAGKLDVSGLGEGEHAGHTHPEGRKGNISGLPGPEDGQVAAVTGKTAYVISNRGAFAVESTSAGFRIRQLTEGKLSSSEISQMQNQIEAWNQNNGGSGRKCTFTPD